MVKSKLLLLSVICVIALVSCKKESLTTLSPADSLVKTKTEGNLVETYYYDNQKRVSKIAFLNLNNNDSYYYEYAYSADEVTEYHSNETIHGLEETLPNGVIKLYCTANPKSYKLNNQGYFIGNSSTCEANSFIYDANGFIVTQSYAVTDFSKNETLKNDSRNIIAINTNGFSFLGGEFKTSVNLDYYYDKPNTIGNKNYGKLFLGKSSENLIKSEAENNLTTKYSYSFDNKQRVTSKTVSIGNTEKVTTYTYY
jgi:hypothetical protein